MLCVIRSPDSPSTSRSFGAGRLYKRNACTCQLHHEGCQRRVSSLPERRGCRTRRMFRFRVPLVQEVHRRRTQDVQHDIQRATVIQRLLAFGFSFSGRVHLLFLYFVMPTGNLSVTADLLISRPSISFTFCSMRCTNWLCRNASRIAIFTTSAR